MAFYVKIIKISEDDEAATFSFGGGSEAVGQFRFDKRSHVASLLTPMPGDTNNHHFDRAVAKIRKASFAGDYPDEDEWAS